jgi:phage shock protein C
MSNLQNLKKATKSSKDKWIGGVCGGLGAATPVPSWMWRAVFVFCLLAFGFGLLLYVVLWIFMPTDKAQSLFENAKMHQ